MNAFVLDASIAVSWCFPDDPSENTPYSQAILDLLEEADAVVPEIWAYEIANSIFVSYRKRKRISDEQIATYIELIESLPVRVERFSWQENVRLEKLARKHNVTAYGVSYLQLAKREGLLLATSDAKLAGAAHADGIGLVMVNTGV